MTLLFTSSRGNFGPLFVTVLLQFVRFFWHSFTATTQERTCLGPATVFQSGWGLDFDCFITTPWLFSFPAIRSWFGGVGGEHIPVAWLKCEAICLAVKACPKLTLEHFGIQRLHCPLKDCKVPRSCACKTRPKHHPSMSLLDSWYEVFVFKFCVWFSPDMALCIIAKHLTCVENIDPEVLWFVQIKNLQT